MSHILIALAQSSSCVCLYISVQTILPLPKSKSVKRILVTGPNANNQTILGDWHAVQPDENVTTIYEGIKNIGTVELEEKLSSRNFCLLDVRTQGEYHSEHLPNSKNIPLNELANRVSELDKSKEIGVICASGSRSIMGAIILKKNGFQNHLFTEKI